ncbi:Alpha-latrocrustotoxin-Lt1a [Schistosoma japonicum]|nr:Alpha-latrocrustotoxin-Lt1a [Schistosoma japonicum]
MTTIISSNQLTNYSSLSIIPKELIIYKFRDYFYDTLKSCKLFFTSKFNSTKPTKITVIDPNGMIIDLINVDKDEIPLNKDDERQYLNVLEENKLFKLPNSLFQYDDIVNTFQNDSLSLNTTENNINRMLHYAVKSGHTDLVKWLLINGADPNYIDELENQLLHYTIISKHLQIFQLLIDFGAKVDVKNRLGAQAIHLACEADFLEGLEVLLEITVDPNTPDEQGATPVHYCCFNDSAACLQFLMKAGGSIYQPDALGKYPIHEAISQSSLQCVKILLECNQYDIQQHNESMTTIKVPSWHEYNSSVSNKLNSYKFASIFSRKYSILSNNSTEKPKKFSDSFEFSIHHDECNQRINKLSKIQQLINLLDGEGFAPIHTAANSGSFELINICLQHKPDILVKDNNGQTVLHYAALRGDLECIKLIIENIKPEEQFTLIHCSNDKEETCLHIAAKHNFVNMGAQINQPDVNGYTPIMSAAIKGSVNTCNYLLNNGAELKHHDVKHRNLLHLLVLSCFDEICDSIETLKNLTVLPELLNDSDNYGFTPLHYAIRLGLVETSLFCLRYGARVTIVNVDKSSSLHLAAKFGRLRISQAILNTTGGMRTLYMADSKGCLPLHIAAYYGQDKLLELFLQNGCLFRRCHEGNTALHYAAMQGNIETCRLLLEINPTLLNQTNYNGMTALHIAAIKDNSRAVEYLLSNGAEIKADHNGLYFSNYAITRQNETTVKEIVFHKRWPEIVELLGNTTHCPFKELIEYMPDICLVRDLLAKAKYNDNCL